ncbi:uncharacterized protein B0J16DRAFT_348404 [Fusarium flagelliforme]|uniref:uncharacterized protein n=1 Tax=Fusarium flagelliforme TaxID=2675880 RepID=UPI001E8DEA3B|nr:uncharacterized protein B0J16DRAFT_348404 [Fusarium flagelliforme]KAH7174305.1 hypothetical protein B0J16DRAFT_348404 [Fusarium flagelliforme]
MPLSKPNSEIVKDWNTLAYDVENLVDNHFRDASQKVILSWATLQIQDLPDIFGAPRDIVTSRKSGIALIKAALWSELSSMFAYSCWAGHYRRDMQTLFTKLEADFSAERNAARPPPYHHCKTLMTNLISTLETREQRGQVVGHVAIAIAELLAPCRPRHLSFNTYHSDLRAVVHKAVNMDLALHGQMDAYTLQWRTGKVFEDAYMAPASGCSQGSSKNVRFRIRPGLYRADAQGDSFSNFAVVEKATVWL